ncbi:hypothetical protein CSUI_003812 [Cystoisospora suis]|uniref:Transmembrane protein n=1 Tax=Cystoisospora suis TaxID=483139 RepID=A0A2C6L3F3_9APIC|nr:hypothetical protein CSUI_003812 [Cystoisospora suis]
MSNHTTKELHSGAQVRSPRQNAQQREAEEAVVALGHRLSGAPIWLKRDPHERLRAPGGSAASCRGGGGCRKGKEVEKHKGYYRKLLFSLFVTSILIATTVVIARNRSRISGKIGTSAKSRLAELNCPLFNRSSVTTVRSQGGERRLAADGTPNNPADQENIDVECATALGLSLVESDRTGRPTPSSRYKPP